MPRALPTGCRSSGGYVNVIALAESDWPANGATREVSAGRPLARSRVIAPICSLVVGVGQFVWPGIWVGAARLVWARPFGGEQSSCSGPVDNGATSRQKALGWAERKLLARDYWRDSVRFRRQVFSKSATSIPKRQLNSPKQSGFRT